MYSGGGYPIISHPTDGPWRECWGGAWHAPASVSGHVDCRYWRSTLIDWYLTRSIWKMLGLFATTSRLTPIQQMSLAVLSRAACASISTTTTRGNIKHGKIPHRNTKIKTTRLKNRNHKSLLFNFCNFYRREWPDSRHSISVSYTHLTLPTIYSV